MLEFKPIKLEDRSLYLEYLKEYRFRTYEYSFNTLYFWRRLLNIEYALIKNSLVVKRETKNNFKYFMEPIGYKDEEELKEIVEELRKFNDNRVIFYGVEEEFLNTLIKLYGDRIQYKEDENNFDYIYSAEDLISLSGKKYHAKKNHYNQFVKSYEYTIKDVGDKEVAQMCMELTESWNENKDEIDIYMEYEIQGIRDFLDNMDELNIKGMAVFVGDKIAGFTLGEKISDEMAIIHTEKANPEYKGIYAFINRTFLETHFSDVKYVNREEDLGIEGLRKAKMSYNPIRLEKKYLVNLI